jgi:hypothetical protein
MRVAALLCCMACGPQAAIWLTIEAPLRVPDQCDALRVQATEHGTVVFDQVYTPLSTQFPQTLTLESTTRAMLGGDVTVNVAARKSGALAAPWSQATGTVTLETGKLAPLTIRLCQCP